MLEEAKKVIFNSSRKANIDAIGCASLFLESFFFFFSFCVQLTLYAMPHHQDARMDSDRGLIAGSMINPLR